MAESSLSEEVPESKGTISDKFGISNKGNLKTSGSVPATVSLNTDDIGDETSGGDEYSIQPKSLETGTEDTT